MAKREIKLKIDADIDKHLVTKNDSTEYIQRLIRKDIKERDDLEDRIDDLEDDVRKLLKLVDHIHAAVFRDKPISKKQIGFYKALSDKHGKTKATIVVAPQKKKRKQSRVTR